MIYQFMGEHPIVTVLLSSLLVSGIINLVNRIMRHWNIHKHGYPPAHCDADGDFKEPEDKP